MAVEYLEGVSLADVIYRSRSAPELAAPRVVVELLAQIATGLDHAHQACSPTGVPLELIHRDLNPHGGFVTREGVVKARLQRRAAARR